MPLALIIAILIFVFVDVVLLILATYFYRKLKTCESEESIFCLNWVCPDGNNALRIHEGKVIESGPFGFIPSQRTISASEVC